MVTTPIDTAAVPAVFRDRISHDFARRHLILATSRDAETVRLAIAKTTDPLVVHNIGVRLGAPVNASVVDAETLATSIDAAYPRECLSESCSPLDHLDRHDHGNIIKGHEDVDQLLHQADADILTTEGKGPIVLLVDAILFEALQRRASDVHIQPLANEASIRYRLDGVLHTVRSIPSRMTNAIVSRIKVMAHMDIAERRVPQGGRATVSLGSRTIDLRISTLPTSYGERAVVRLLDNQSHLADFSQLGMPADVCDAYLNLARRANGIILLTGPTGSGKTTTLYATLRELSTSSAGNIMTIEDPIEYELSTAGIAISQSQINPRKGVTFATGLRHILRQDPDVVMVGEIRDEETARIAIQSSLTGHLVFSTLHTNDSASAVTRLVDLGIEAYLVSASLSAVVAQRLVRLFHTECKGTGCTTCLETGFHGRTGLYELLAVNEHIRELIGKAVSVSMIRSAAVEGGMRALADEGNRLVSTGRTAKLEVERVVQRV